MDHRNGSLYSPRQMISGVDPHEIPLVQRASHPNLVSAQYHGYGYGIGIPQVQDYGRFDVPWQQGFWNYSPQLVQQGLQDYSNHQLCFPFHHQLSYHGSGTWPQQQDPVNWVYLAQLYRYVWEVLWDEEENSLADWWASEDGIENNDDNDWEEDQTDDPLFYQTEIYPEDQTDDPLFYQTEIYPSLEDITSEDEIENFEDHTEYQLPLEDIYPDDIIEISDLENDGSVILTPFNMGRLNVYLLAPQDAEANEGLQEDTISKNLRTRNYLKEEDLAANSHSDEPEMCIVCQLEYEDKETLGVLGCGHEYHAECIKRWLLQKNVCPLCKQTALQV